MHGKYTEISYFLTFDSHVGAVIFCLCVKSHVFHMLQDLKHEITDPSLPGILEDKCGIPHYRAEYIIPQKVYLCGNSLGLLPAKTQELIAEELQVWGEKGVHGHFDHPYGRPWVSVDDLVVDESAKIVGAKRNEVALMNSLTANLHLLMISFYRPAGKRFKIIMESHAFPSDYVSLYSSTAVCNRIPSEISWL